MIAALRGQVLGVGLDHAVVEVGGVGLAVHATPSTLAGLRRGAEVRLATTLVVREDALTLYGFSDTVVRDLFVLLQTVNGVGPRLALATLAVLHPDELRRAVAEGDLTALTRVPGIGRKGAERLVVELRDRVAPASTAAPGSTRGSGGAAREQVTAALVGLGFALKVAEQAVDAVLGENGEAPDTAAVLRSALARLGGTR